jgi:hypothetical protein
MTKLVGTFVEHTGVVDGMLVATLHDRIVWAGPVHMAPLESFEEGTLLRVHPVLLRRIQFHVDQVEPGGIDGNRS